MTFALLCGALIALGFGLAIAFGGYKLFLVLLPIWGFFVGFALGAQTVQAIFSDAFLATITSWVVGFIIGAIFAVLSYLFYIFAVAILSFSFGYGATVGILTAIGLNFGLIVWIIAVVVGVIVAGLVILLNIQKYAIIVITAIAGAGVIIYTFLAAFGGLSPLEMASSPVLSAIQDSFWWLLFFLVVAGAGIFVQIMANREYEVEEYNRWAY